MTDHELEIKWRQLDNVLFFEKPDGELCLEEDWFVFHAGTYREDIWHWFDKRHSKGIAWLLYEFVLEG